MHSANTRLCKRQPLKQRLTTFSPSWKAPRTSAVRVPDSTFGNADPRCQAGCHTVIRIAVDKHGSSQGGIVKIFNWRHGQPHLVALVPANSPICLTAKIVRLCFFGLQVPACQDQRRHNIDLEVTRPLQFPECRKFLPLLPMNNCDSKKSSSANSLPSSTHNFMH